MNFVLSYFRLTLFQLYLELRETEKRSNSFEIRLESLFPYTFPLPPPSSPPPAPTFLPENRCQRRVADREITASVSRFSSIALVHVHQGNSVDRFRGNEQDFAQKHGTASTGPLKNNRRISNLPALSQDDIWDDVLQRRIIRENGASGIDVEHPRAEPRSRDSISTTKRRRRRRRRLCSVVGSCSICTYGSKSDLIH